jgi:hypothetical protein
VATCRHLLVLSAVPNFVKRWKVVFPLVLAPGENLMENICENYEFQELSAGQNR